MTQHTPETELHMAYRFDPSAFDSPEFITLAVKNFERDLRRNINEYRETHNV